MSQDDELSCPKLHILLKEAFPNLEVSMTTVKSTLYRSCGEFFPVEHITHYQQYYAPLRHHPLFHFRSGHVLTPDLFHTNLQKLLQHAGSPPHQFNTHNLHICKCSCLCSQSRNPHSHNRADESLVQRGILLIHQEATLNTLHYSHLTSAM